jgi:hypothetical protein
LGLIAVAAGTAWSTGGYAAVQRGAAALVAAIPFLLIAGGLILLLRVLAPRGVLAGPLVLMGAGGIWAVASEGLLSLAVERVLPIVLTIGGVAIAMSNRSHEPDLDIGVVTRTAFLFPRRVELDSPPQKLAVRAILGDANVNLSQLAREPMDDLHLDLLIFYGRVELLLPRQWTVVHGQVESARRVAVSGELDRPYREPRPDEKQYADWDDAKLRTVINLSGLGGALILVRTG